MTADARAESRYRLLFWIVILAATGLRLATAGRVGLSTDEAHYVMYARHLAWGYFDHPPMVAFLGALTTAAGDSWLLMRLGPILSWLAACVLLRWLALELYRSERVVLLSALLMLSIPLCHLLAVALLPDATLNVFWCAALLASWRATHGAGWSAWLLAGACFGGALLSKYHGVLLPLCLLCYLLSSREQRAWLARPQPWVAVALGLIVFLPNVLWNAQNDWISYAFQLRQGAGGGFEPVRLLENVAGQLGAASPILLGLLVAGWLALLRRRPVSDADRFALATSLPVFAFFCAVGFSGKLLPHWTAVGWWTGSLVVVRAGLAALEAGGARARRWRRWAVAGTALAWLMIVAIYAGVARPLVGQIWQTARPALRALAERVPALEPPPPFGPRLDLTNDLYGWETAARRIEEIRSSMPRPERTFVFTHRFFTTSSLAVYLAPDTVATSLYHKPSQYRLWFDAPEHAGWDALFVDENRFWKGPERYRRLFDDVDLDPVVIEIERDGWPAHDVHVYRYYGFKGEYESF
jgi:4-amino-4-deoxy-L-arabinose transferase-like glycosyltransferase